MITEEDQRMEQIFERVYAQAKGTGSFLEEWLKPEMPINQDMIHAAAQRKRWHSIRGGLQALAENRIGGRRCAHSHELEELCVLITCQ